jgi:multidrug efflux pump subunit AcrA (membrane-fusion protein)
LAEPEATLASTEEELAGTQSTLAETEATLADTEAELASTQNTLAETAATLADTQSELESTQNTLADTEATLASTEAELESTQNTLSETEATLEDRQQQLDELMISPDAENYKVEYIAGRMEDGLATDITRKRVKIDFSNLGMYVNNVKLEILNPDKEVIYSSTLRPGEVRYIVDVSEPVVPGELYWVRRTYYDGNNKEISQLTIQVRVYIGL